MFGAEKILNFEEARKPTRILPQTNPADGKSAEEG
jgi:hypothetical protein